MNNSYFSEVEDAKEFNINDIKSEENSGPAYNAEDPLNLNNNNNTPKSYTIEEIINLHNKMINDLSNEYNNLVNDIYIMSRYLEGLHKYITPKIESPSEWAQRVIQEKQSGIEPNFNVKTKSGIIVE